MYQKPGQLPLRETAAFFAKKLKKIKVFLVDVDGVLTDGLIFWSGQEVGWNRKFHTQDGYGLKMLIKAGIKVGIISGGSSVALKQRIETIKPHYAFMGDENKLSAYNFILKDAKVKPDEVLYIGDEIFDLPILKRVGFSVTVPHASLEIQDAVDYITYRDGGQACVREVVDLVRYAQKIPVKNLPKPQKPY